MDEFVATEKEKTFKQNALQFLNDCRAKTASKHCWLYADMNWGSYCSKENSSVKKYTAVFFVITLIILLE